MRAGSPHYRASCMLSLHDPRARTPVFPLLFSKQQLRLRDRGFGTGGFGCGGLISQAGLPLRALL